MKFVLLFTIIATAASLKFNRHNVLKELMKELVKDEILSSNDASFCKGKADGDYANPDNCKGYITCSSGNTWERPCPSGLVWDDQKKRCDWANKVRCKQSNEATCRMGDKTYKAGETWIYGDCNLKCHCPTKPDEYGSPSCDLICPRSVHPCGYHGIKGIEQVPSDVKGCTCPKYICNPTYEV